MRKAAHAILPDAALLRLSEPSSPPDTASVLLHRLHVELATLARSVLTTQHALSPILAQLPSMPAEAIEEAQRLDLIEQSLRDLAAVTALASTAPTTQGAVDLDALTEVCLLADLAARLRGDAPEAQTSTDLELF